MDPDVLSDELIRPQERRLRYLLGVEPLPGPDPDLTTRVVARARRRRARQVLSVVVIVMVLAGTAGLMHLQSAGQSERVPATRPSPSAATAKAWTVGQACDYWRTAAAPGTRTWAAMHLERTKQASGTASWRTVRDAFGTYGSAIRKVAGQLGAPPQPWPAQLDPWVQPIVTFDLQQADWADSVHQAATETDFNRLYDADPSLTPTGVYEQSGSSVARACGIKATPPPG